MWAAKPTTCSSRLRPITRTNRRSPASTRSIRRPVKFTPKRSALLFYNGTAQRELGVKFGTPHQWSQRIDYMANQATGSYNALQIVLNKRFTSGLQFLTHYTWSHALGHESYQFLIGPKIGRGTATTTAAKPSSLLETMICLSAEISSSAPAYPAGSTRSSADSN
jgi:hypothetical protein